MLQNTLEICFCGRVRNVFAQSDVLLNGFCVMTFCISVLEMGAMFMIYWVTWFHCLCTFPAWSLYSCNKLVRFVEVFLIVFAAFELTEIPISFANPCVLASGIFYTSSSLIWWIVELFLYFRKAISIAWMFQFIPCANLFLFLFYHCYVDICSCLSQ